MPSRHGKAGPKQPGPPPRDEDDEEDEEQTSLLGAEASDSGGDVAPSGGEASIYANEDEEEEPDACKVIVSLIPIVYAPSLLYSLGEAITDPVLLLYATDTLGTSVSTAAFAVSANHYGKLLSNVPAGMLYTRLGPGPSMFVAAVRLLLLLLPLRSLVGSESRSFAHERCHRSSTQSERSEPSGYPRLCRTVFRRSSPSARRSCCAAPPTLSGRLLDRSVRHQGLRLSRRLSGHLS